MGLVVLRLNILKEENVIEFCYYNMDDNSFKCIINDKDVYYIRINNLDNGNVYSCEYGSYSVKYKVFVINKEVELYLGIKC